MVVKKIQFTTPELIAVSTLPYSPERVNFRKSLYRIGLQPALNVIQLHFFQQIRQQRLQFPESFLILQFPSQTLIKFLAEIIDNFSTFIVFISSSYHINSTLSQIIC